MTDRPDLAALAELQSRDTALDVLVHRRSAMTERDELERTLRAGKDAHDQLVVLRGSRDQLARAVKTLDDETQSVAAKAKSVDEKLYSGSVTSPRELQDLQADLNQVRRHLGELEERELEQMVAAEELDQAVLTAEQGLASLGATVERLRTSIAVAEREIDAEQAVVSEERALIAATIAPPLLADYERRRLQNKGVGAALLVGDTCQGCRLSIPATEVDEIRHDTNGRIFSCDNCGSILVPR
jgi:predicted  nucleic acid-binding Zn-ribbon protein